MILYKYMSLNSARAIAKGNAIGFREPRYFNDPFELKGQPRTPDDPDSPELVGMRGLFKSAIWSSRTAMLCLTRDPLNPLMWAHYAEEHQGVVLGFNVANEVFTSEKRNLVPVQHGNVIYTASRPLQQCLGPKPRVNVGAEFSYRAELNEFLQRLFLFKSSCWAYEEEVRVVRSLGCSEGMVSIESKGRPLHLEALPAKTVQEVYLGLRCDEGQQAELSELFKRSGHEASFYRCCLGSTNWGLERDPLYCE